jgi:CheY-like chemotaxis protein
MLRALVGERIRIKFETARDLPSVHADPGMMEQVLVNMVVNARDAMEQGGEITLRTAFLETDPQFLKEHASARPGKFVRLSIQDTGHGMEEETMHHIFEPFFTTKGVGKGTGLGLATVNAIVTQHAGWIEVRSSPSRGTTFDVFLPITTKAPLQSEKGGPTTVMGGHETILVVEDEASLRDLIRELLEKRGYRVFHVTNGSDALKVWRERREEIDMLLTDMMLPEGIMGRELAERMSEERPDLRILYTSGYSLDVVHPGFVSTPRRQFLQKPYPPELLLRAVRDCLDGKMPESADGGASPIPMEEHELELCTPSE